MDALRYRMRSNIYIPNTNHMDDTQLSQMERLIVEGPEVIIHRQPMLRGLAFGVSYIVPPEGGLQCARD